MPPETSSPVTVANCYDVHEATRIKLALEASGIPAFIPDELTAGIAPFHFMTTSGVRVQVAESFAEEARGVIGDLRRRDESADERSH
jgi:hypothetical protein